MKFRGYIWIFLLLLTGCSSLKIDDSYQSVSQDSRVQFIVLHYTASQLPRSLEVLTQGKVSSHYLITEHTIANQAATIYRLVDENQRAWHAGDSQWQGRTWLNASSIGIEMVHRGFTVNPQGHKEWLPWSEPQIDALILLLTDIMQRHGLSADSVVGHSDIAPQRKLDPGPLFPWHRLAKAGLIHWPEPQLVAKYQTTFSEQLPSITWFQTQLAKVGYAVPQHGKLDKATRNVVAAFQMKYRPVRFDGEPDAHTAALLLALNNRH
ncbi:N-acetylmuramoyl-L-alanine amidase [Oceanisphaera sp. IT1-181]|uniref:N-acetylmuramoyl-L-alanine amidase n=1 Tax=Oceanisphaera sp. IT1-181 TaxID=3081199 RepID=UPI0029CA413B|nr:N-acetylmuramoyl-L-alanine amidase [Oceanisphaera sp. IT1-181]